jgi:hypothetical protein
MSGENVMHVHVCGGTRWVERRILFCPTCCTRRRVAVAHTSVWYSPIFSCCACGDSWGDGEILPRPFAPGWRVKAAQKARKAWDAGVTRREADRRIRAEIYGDLNQPEETP